MKTSGIGSSAAKQGNTWLSCQANLGAQEAQDGQILATALGICGIFDKMSVGQAAIAQVWVSEALNGADRRCHR